MEIYPCVSSNSTRAPRKSPVISRTGGRARLGLTGKAMSRLLNEINQWAGWKSLGFMALVRTRIRGSSSVLGCFPNRTKTLCWWDAQSNSSETSVVEGSNMVVQEKSEETDIRGGTHKSTRSKTQARSYEFLYENHVEL
jgi:hypothetical protein